MSRVAVHEGESGGKLAPVFQEIRKRFEDVRRRAHEFFEKRQERDAALEDWLKAEREVLGLPAAELIETEGGYQAAVALPGFDPKDISVTVSSHEIVVHASRQREQHGREQYGKDRNVLWSEFGSTDVYRRLETPEAIDTENNAEKITANLEKGLLRIDAPKARTASSGKAASAS